MNGYSGTANPIAQRFWEVAMAEILVVDDFKDVADSMARVLRLWGHNV
jgi:hypothetical protein